MKSLSLKHLWLQVQKEEELTTIDEEKRNVMLIRDQVGEDELCFSFGREKKRGAKPKKKNETKDQGK